MLLLAVGGAAFALGYSSRRETAAPQPEVVTNASRAFREVREARSALETVQSLPYVNSARDPHGKASGVLLHDRARAYEGYTLYGPRARAAAFLVDMDGKVAWKWRSDRTSWHHFALLPDGGLIALVDDESVDRLDVHSNTSWSTPGNVHHDLWVEGDNVWVLEREERLEPALHESRPILIDKITQLSLEDGRRIGEIDLLNTLLQSQYSFLVPAISHREFPGNDAPDLLHSNHVEVFDGTQAHRSAMFRAGNILVSLRNINTILILDPRTRSIEWIWGPSSLTLQHHPTLLTNGNLLVFNNGIKRSSVLELDPIANRVVWKYEDDTFYSRMRGSVQRLPNGNTLITESDTGHVFEVTAGGERVWELANPDIDDEGMRGVIWRATRFAASEIDFLP